MFSRSHVRQWIASLSVCLSVTMAAVLFMWMTPLMVRFTEPDSPIPMTTYDTSWLSSVMEIGQVVGTIPVGMVADRWGRKFTMLIVGPVVLISFIIALSSKAIEALYVVKVLQGMSLAVPYIVTPMYLAEIAEPKLRGQIGAYFQVFHYLGCLYIFLIAPYVDYQVYLYILCIPTLLFIGSSIIIPESPYYLLTVKKEDKALKSLTWLRANTDITEEFYEMKDNADEELKNDGSWMDLISTKQHIKVLLIVEVVSVVGYTNGFLAMGVYITQILSESGTLFLDPDLLGIIYAVIMLVAGFFASIVADRVGRRRLILISTAGAAIFHIISAIYHYLHRFTDMDVTPQFWLAYVCLIGFGIIYTMGLGPVMVIIQAEYFPSQNRGKGGAITILVVALASFVTIKTYQIVEDDHGLYMNFVIYALISIAGFIIFWATIPETAGKSLGEVQKMLLEPKKNKRNPVIVGSHREP